MVNESSGRAGQLTPSRAPTMKDVAKHAGVSPQLVSLVIRGEPGPSEASRELILAAAAELHFRPNASARLLRQRRTRLIGVLFTALNSFEMRFVERLIERAAEEGYDVALGPVTATRTTEIVVAQLLEQRIEALACYNPDPESPALQTALDTLPVVWMGERSTDPRVDVVRTDDDGGLQLLVDHLVALGHTRIAYAGGLDGQVGLDRADTYQVAMAKVGLSNNIDVVPVGFLEEDGATAARMLLERDQLPTAVIGCSDHCAAGLLATFSRAGVSVPETISVTGYDDSDIAALSYNDITAVRQDIELTVDATLAAITRRLHDSDADHHDTATAATLTVRGSTGAARG